jgi:hypothetical protein
MGAEATKLEVIRAHCLGGGKDVAVGTILTAPGDLSQEEALAKVRMGYAVVVEVKVDQIPTAAEVTATEEEPAAEGSSGPVEIGDPAVENRDPVEPTPSAAPAATTVTKPKQKKKGPR